MVTKVILVDCSHGQHKSASCADLSHASKWGQFDPSSGVHYLTGRTKVGLVDARNCGADE